MTEGWDRSGQRREPDAPEYGQPPYGQPQYGQPQYGQPQYGQPQYGQPYYGAPPARETEQNAIIALVLAGIAWATCLLIPLDVAALVLASKAKRSIDASGGAKTGLGLVTAARILSWTHIGLFLLFVLLGFLGYLIDTAETASS